MKKSRWNTLCSLDIAITASSSVGCEFRKQMLGCRHLEVCFPETSDLKTVHDLPLGAQTCPTEAESDIGTFVHSGDFWWKDSEVKWEINIRFLRDSQVWISKHHRFGSKENNLENITNFLELLSIAQWPWVLGHQKEISRRLWCWDYVCVQWFPECCIWTGLTMAHSLSLIT